ncbi:MAG TPA: hypothetical protein VGM62_08210 [Chthoniobacterales bacterium]|jgi:hypothetical protein
MNSLTLRAAAGLFFFSLITHPVFAGSFHTKVITSSSEALEISVADNVFLQIRNFTQQGGVSRGVVTATINDQDVNVLAASLINSTSLAVAPEVINRIVVAGPATVAVAPVAGATLTITYRKVRDEGGPSSTPAPTPTPTVSPTATPTPTP